MIDDDDVAAVAAALRSDFLTTGPAVDAFESAFAARVDVPHAIACSSGTAALHLAALALDLKPGDHVIVPAITFLATANAARFVGAEVAFADVDPNTGPDDLAAAIDAAGTSNAKAVFPVHLAGQPVELPALAAQAEAAGLALVEDACHALGTRYLDGNVDFAVGACRHAAMATFSFHPVKTIACGEGGMVTTRDDALATKLRRFRNHGMGREADSMLRNELAFDTDDTLNPWYYEMGEIGFNYRLSDIQAALGLSQLTKLDRFIERRTALVALYDRLLAPLAPAVKPLGRTRTTRIGWHLYPALIDFDAIGQSRARVMKAMRDRGVITQVHYIPVPWQPYYRDRYGDAELPGARRYYERTLSLPLFPAMSDNDVERVVEALGETCF